MPNFLFVCFFCFPHLFCEVYLSVYSTVTVHTVLAAPQFAVSSFTSALPGETTSRVPSRVLLLVHLDAVDLLRGAFTVQ